LKGEQHDYTKEKLNRAILLLAVPMVLEMVESLFAIVDVFWVSRLGRDAVAVIGLTESVMSLVYAVAIGISFAATAIVGYTIAIRIVVFALMPAWGLSNAGATLVGQNLGAQQPDRAEAAVRIATRFNAMLLGVVGAVFVILAYPLAGLFTSDPETLTYAARGLWIVSLAFPLYAAGMCFEGAFNGLGALGVFISVPVSFSVLALWSAVLFKRGKWKLQKV
jgi:Na+-driven multidrug efflux pump